MRDLEKAPWSVTPKLDAGGEFLVTPPDLISIQTENK
jgi:hypothetical protein